MLSIKFQDNRPFLSGERAKNRFSRWRPSRISHRNNFNYFYLQVTLMLPTKFVSLSVHEKKRKIDFQDGRYGGLLGFYLFLIKKSSQCFLPSYKSIGPSVQKKKRKIDFQDGRLGFPIRKMLAIFDLQVTPMLSTKFQVMRRSKN